MELNDQAANMELIEDLGTDVAVALFVERKHFEGLDASEAMSLIGRIRNALEPYPDTSVLTEVDGLPKTASA